MSWPPRGTRRRSCCGRTGCAAGRAVWSTRLDRAEVERVYRFEGPSDPDEEAVVYALRCPICHGGGTLVSGFGPGADPELADRLVMLDGRFKPDRGEPHG